MKSGMEAAGMKNANSITYSIRLEHILIESGIKVVCCFKLCCVDKCPWRYI